MGYFFFTFYFQDLCWNRFSACSSSSKAAIFVEEMLSIAH